MSQGTSGPIPAPFERKGVIHPSSIDVVHWGPGGPVAAEDYNPRLGHVRSYIVKEAA